MKLIIMRHGQAELISESDETRALTSLGRQQVSDAGKWLAKSLGEKTSIDLAMVSPFIRAQQTYDELSLVVNVSEKIDTLDAVPDGNPAIFHDYMHMLIEQNPAYEIILVVSHMPFVSYFLEEIHKEKKSKLFDTSSIVIVEYDPVARSGDFRDAFHPQS